MNSAFLAQFFANAGAIIREYRTIEEHDLDLAAGRLDAIFAAVTAMTVYRLRLVRHRFGAYAARAVVESCWWRTALGVLRPWRSMSQVVL